VKPPHGPVVEASMPERRFSSSASREGGHKTILLIKALSTQEKQTHCIYTPINYAFWLMVKALHPTRHKTDHFGDALPSQSLS